MNKKYIHNLRGTSSIYKMISIVLIMFITMLGCKNIPKEYYGLCRRYKIYYHPQEDIYFLKIKGEKLGGYSMAKYNGSWYGYTYFDQGYNVRVYKAGPYETLEAAVQAQELKLTINGRIDFDDEFNVLKTSYQYKRDNDGALQGISPVYTKRNLINKSGFQTICE